jgi:hypothetical protein
MGRDIGGEQKTYADQCKKNAGGAKDSLGWRGTRDLLQDLKLRLLRSMLRWHPLVPQVVGTRLPWSKLEVVVRELFGVKVVRGIPNPLVTGMGGGFIVTSLMQTGPFGEKREVAPLFGRKQKLVYGSSRVHHLEICFREGMATVTALLPRSLSCSWNGCLWFLFSVPKSRRNAFVKTRAWCHPRLLY